MSKTFKNEEKEGEKIIEEKEEEREDDGEDGKGSPQTDFSRFQGLPGASHSVSYFLFSIFSFPLPFFSFFFFFCFVLCFSPLISFVDEWLAPKKSG